MYVLGRQFTHEFSVSGCLRSHDSKRACRFECPAGVSLVIHTPPHSKACMLLGHPTREQPALLYRAPQILFDELQLVQNKLFLVEKQLLVSRRRASYNKFFVVEMPPFRRTTPADLATAVGPCASHKKPPVAMSQPVRYAPSTRAPVG